ncbi:MAG TPA: histidinol-phosphate transaminase, partial [Planctomycetota bacterium]|nr:histidinol-phosphate transaminase [Planctomycetota bacterium]
MNPGDLAVENVRTLAPYVPGKPIEELERELRITGIIKLASNENPFGPSPKALAAMHATLSDAWLY